MYEFDLDRKFPVIPRHTLFKQRTVDSLPILGLRDTPPKDNLQVADKNPLNRYGICPNPKLKK